MLYFIREIKWDSFIWFNEVSSSDEVNSIPVWADVMILLDVAHSHLDCYHKYISLIQLTTPPITWVKIVTTIDTSSPSMMTNSMPQPYHCPHSLYYTFNWYSFQKHTFLYSHLHYPVTLRCWIKTAHFKQLLKGNNLFSSCQACLCFENALKCLGSTTKHGDFRNTVLWDYSTCYAHMGILLQDFPPIATTNIQEVKLNSWWLGLSNIVTVILVLHLHWILTVILISHLHWILHIFSY